MANEYAVNQADLTSVAAAIRTKGGTSAALEFPAGFVSAVEAIQAGGDAGLDVVGAASYMPQTYDGVKSKEILPVPANFAYNYAYTNTSDTITMSIDANSGDTIIAAFAIRHLTETPDAPEGWELIRHCTPHAGDTAYEQALLVYKYRSDSAGTVSVTMKQPNLTQRFYGFILNLRDSMIGRIELIYNELSGGVSIDPVHFNYEHTLAIMTNPLCQIASTPKYRLTGFCLDGALTTFHPKILYGDDADGSYTQYSSRLSLIYRPFGSKQNSDSHYVSNRNYDGSIAPKASTTFTCLLIEIIPGACTQWATASDDTLTLAKLEAGVELSAEEAMSIILGGES